MLADAVISVLTGMATGLATWWYVTRYLRPRLVLDPMLSWYLLAAGGKVKRSQVRLTIGRRDVIELKVTIRLRIPGLIAPGSTEILRLLHVEVPFLAARGRARWRITVHRMSDDTWHRYGYWLPEWREHVEQRTPIDVKAFLEAYPGSTIEVTAIARDAVTGAATATRRLYGEADFHDGKFPRHEPQPTRTEPRPQNEPRMLSIRWVGWLARWCYWRGPRRGVDSSLISFEWTSPALCWREDPSGRGQRMAALLIERIR